MDRSYERDIMEHNAKGYQEIANGYQRLYMKWKKEIYSKLSEAYQEVATNCRRAADVFKTYK